MLFNLAELLLGQSSQLSCLQKTEKIIKYHLIRNEKVHSWSLAINAHKKRVWDMKEVENYRGKLC